MSGTAKMNPKKRHLDDNHDDQDNASKRRSVEVKLESGGGSGADDEPKDEEGRQPAVPYRSVTVKQENVVGGTDNCADDRSGKPPAVPYHSVSVKQENPPIAGDDEDPNYEEGRQSWLWSSNTAVEVNNQAAVSTSPNATSGTLSSGQNVSGPENVDDFDDLEELSTMAVFAGNLEESRRAQFLKDMKSNLRVSRQYNTRNHNAPTESPVPNHGVSSEENSDPVVPGRYQWIDDFKLSLSTPFNLPSPSTEALPYHTQAVSVTFGTTHPRVATREQSSLSAGATPERNLTISATGTTDQPVASYKIPPSVNNSALSAVAAAPAHSQDIVSTRTTQKTVKYRDPSSATLNSSQTADVAASDHNRAASLTRTDVAASDHNRAASLTRSTATQTVASRDVTSCARNPTTTTSALRDEATAARSGAYPNNTGGHLYTSTFGSQHKISANELQQKLDELVEPATTTQSCLTILNDMQRWAHEESITKMVNKIGYQRQIQEAFMHLLGNRKVDTALIKAATTTMQALARDDFWVEHVVGTIKVRPVIVRLIMHFSRILLHPCPKKDALMKAIDLLDYLTSRRPLRIDGNTLSSMFGLLPKIRCRQVKERVELSIGATLQRHRRSGKTCAVLKNDRGGLITKYLVVVKRVSISSFKTVCRHFDIISKLHGVITKDQDVMLAVQLFKRWLHFQHSSTPANVLLSMMGAVETVVQDMSRSDVFKQMLAESIVKFIGSSSEQEVRDKANNILLNILSKPDEAVANA